MDSQITEWLNSMGVYNIIVSVDGTNYKINRSLGISVATNFDLGFPSTTPPDWLVATIQQQVK